MIDDIRWAGIIADDIENINLAHREIHNGNIIHLINKPNTDFRVPVNVTGDVAIWLVSESQYQDNISSNHSISNDIDIKMGDWISACPMNSKGYCHKYGQSAIFDSNASSLYQDFLDYTTPFKSLDYNDSSTNNTYYAQTRFSGKIELMLDSWTCTNQGTIKIYEDGTLIETLTGSETHIYRKIFKNKVSVVLDSSTSTIITSGYVRLIFDENKTNCCIARALHDFSFRNDDNSGQTSDYSAFQTHSFTRNNITVNAILMPCIM